MALVLHSAALTGRRERLAGAGEREDGAVIGPPRLAKGILPDPHAPEQMPLREAFEVLGFDIEDGALVDLAIGDHAFGDQLAEPGGFSGIPLPVIDHGLHTEAGGAQLGGALLDGRGLAVLVLVKGPPAGGVDFPQVVAVIDHQPVLRLGDIAVGGGD